jgi:hypothetical protein
MLLLRILSMLSMLFVCASLGGAQDSLNVRRVGEIDYWNGDTYCRTWGVDALGSFAYITLGDSGLRIINVSDPVHPIETGFLQASGFAWRVLVEGNFAYLASSDSLRVVNITNPANPFEVSSYGISHDVRDVVIVGNYLYMTVGQEGMKIIDVTNPFALIEIGYFATHGSPVGLAVSGNYAYVTEEGNPPGFAVVDISNPALPQEVGHSDGIHSPWFLTVSGNYLYMADEMGGIFISDISNPVIPTWIDFYQTVHGGYDLEIDGHYMYLANGTDGLRVLDITDPTTPTEVGFHQDAPYMISQVAVAGRYVFAAQLEYFSVFDCSAATSISESIVPEPASFELACYPNPFNPSTQISFNLPRANPVKLSVYNLSGQLVQTLIDKRMSSGAHMIRFDGSNLSSGAYLYRLDSPDNSAIRKMLLIK